MSPNNPGNFVNDLVEMAKAFEALPKALADLELARGELDAKATTIQRLELKLADRANEVQDGLARIRKLEEEKDATETMFLEADDRTARALDFIKATFGNAGSLIQALEPVKAQPEPAPKYGEVEYTDGSGLMPIPNVNVPKPEPEGLHTTQPQGQSEVGEPSSDGSSQTSSIGAPSEPSASPAPEVAPAHPTQGSDATTQTLASESSHGYTTVETAEPNSDLSFPMPPLHPGRYSGKTYSAAKQEAGGMWTWPNKDEWLDNGGTLDNFYA